MDAALGNPRVALQPSVKLAYTVRFEPAEEGGYTVTVPALPGCVTEGDTYEDALAMAEEAIAGYLEALRKLRKPIPIEGAPRGPLDSRVVVDEPVPA